MAGAERIELPSKVLETPMLPLYHAPVANKLYHIYLIKSSLFFKFKKFIFFQANT